MARPNVELASGVACNLADCGWMRNEELCVVYLNSAFLPTRTQRCCGSRMGPAPSAQSLLCELQVDLFPRRVQAGDAEAANLAGLEFLRLRRRGLGSAFPSGLQHGS